MEKQELYQSADHHGQKAIKWIVCCNLRFVIKCPSSSSITWRDIHHGGGRVNVVDIDKNTIERIKEQQVRLQL